MDSNKPRKSKPKKTEEHTDRKPMVVKLSTFLMPDHVETNEGNYILWGPKHSVPRELISALDKSNTHRSIILSLRDQFAGYGFQKEVNGEVNPQLANALSKANRLGESFDDILSKCAFDYAVFGAFALELNWNINRDKLVECYHIDYSTIASGLADEYNTVQLYYHSTDWTTPEPKTTPIKSFLPEQKDSEGNFVGRLEAKNILVHKPYYPGKAFYPSPDYWASMRWLEIDSQLASYKVNGLINKFSAGMIISLNGGVPSPAERDAIERMIKENFTGDNANETLIVDFAESKENAATFTAVPTSDSQTKYGNMEEEKVTEILKAHRITSPMLVGVPTQNGFSSNADEIKNAYELFFRYVIQPKQKVLEEKFSTVLKYFGHDYKLKINPALPFELKSQGKSEAVLSALNSVSPLIGNKILESMSANEIRALIGLPELEVQTEPSGATASTPPADNKNDINPNE
ncbi:MAG TPA: hypothetical protein VF868_15255 [Bacteroidia bacterium]|jgi:hypothetical protein